MNEFGTSDLEAQLRMLMNIAAGEPPRRVTAEAIRRGVIRRRVISGMAAAVAMVLIGGIGVAFAAGRLGQGPAATKGPLPAGVPRFYVVRAFFFAGGGTTVRATATGAVTAKVHCPWRQAGVQPTSLAPANHRVFFLVCTRFVRKGARDIVTGSRIFRLQLTQSGRIGSRAPVRGGILNGLSAGDIAATPDGSELAVPVRPGLLSLGQPVAPEIFVINPRTGRHAVWHGVGPVPGKIFYPVGSVSLTANGQVLAYLSQPRCIHAKNGPKCRVGGGEEIRAVSHAADGGNLSDSRLLLRQSRIMRLSTGFINDVVISPDGSTLTLAIVGNVSGLPRPSSVSIAQVPVTGSRRLHYVFRMRTGNGFSYQFVAADPSVRHFLFDAGPTSGAVFGWVNHGRLVRLKPVGDSLFFGAW
jgi:hypothetical protein